MIDFKKIRSQRVRFYDLLPLDLSIVRSNEEFNIAGTYLHALEATDNDSNVDIKFNELSRSEINFSLKRGIRTPFYRLFISNNVQAGKSITFAIGTEENFFQIIEPTATELTGEIDANILSDLSHYYLQQTDKNAFIGGHYEAAQASKYSQVILSNPNGSGITAVIEAFACAFDVLSGIRIINAAGAFGSLQRYGINKYQGEADSLCQIRSSAVTTPVTGKDSGALLSVSTPSHRVELKHGLILPENYSIVIRPGAVLVYNVTMFEWIEI